VEYRFSQDPPISEDEALAEAASLGFHAIAYDYTDVDEPLHWHEFDSVTWIIEGSGEFADEHGEVTEFTAGCRLQAPAGWLHRNLAGGTGRVVVSTNLPGEQWTTPINKDPADRPAHLGG
jgi:hypothetical protein